MTRIHPGALTGGTLPSPRSVAHRLKYKYGESDSKLTEIFSVSGI